ncbi:bola-like protein [Artomyces pyxidatus]|uniref:Bola-like protein n=1 Tax=Artomyces pyxidatus TaxID=48021 RepID=A0ACB8TL55_9AGAM|nr:bola-like protein [Artomyces pyxidatus]
MFSCITRRAPRALLQARSYTAATRPTLDAPSQLDEGERAIFRKLADRFQPSELLVQDVSGGCGTFYAITIASEAFKGIPIVKQHRLVNEVLKKDIEGIHGLQLKTIPQ